MATSKAKESPSIENMRKKLRKRIDEEKKSTSEEALKEMSKEIHRRLGRQAEKRITLKDKNIILFDTNQHPAQVQSKFVKNLLRELQQNSLSPAKKQKERLNERVSKS